MRSYSLALLMLICFLGNPILAAQKASNQDRPQFKLLHILSTDFDQSSVVFSPDSQQILSGGWNTLVGVGYDGEKNRYFQDGLLRTWSVASGKLLKEQPTKFPLMAMAYSPDGKLFATGYGGRVRISSADTGKTIRQMNIDTDSDPTGVESLVFSPDSRTLACGTVVAGDHSETGPFYLWNVTTGREYGSKYRGFFQSLDRNGDNRDQWFAVAPAKQLMVSQSERGLIVRQNRGAGYTQKILSTFNSVPLTISSDGKYVIGASDSLQVWDLKRGRRVANIGCDAEGDYPSVAISPDMQYVALTRSHKIYVWRVHFQK